MIDSLITEDQTKKCQLYNKYNEPNDLRISFGFFIKTIIK